MMDIPKIEQSSILQQMRKDFENWIKTQDVYATLVFQHGPNLFNFDSIDGYSALAVRTAFELWKQLHCCRQENKALLKQLNVKLENKPEVLLKKAVCV